MLVHGITKVTKHNKHLNKALAATIRSIADNRILLLNS